MSYPDMSKSFILDTDASRTAIGGVLSQVHDDGEHVVAYFSRCLSKHERHYCITRKEMLAVVDAIKHFHYYLFGTIFLVRTDHGALSWLRRLKNPEGQLARWIQVRDTYNFEIRHRPGKQHNNADGLSRRPCQSCKFCSRQEDKDIISCEHVAHVSTQSSSLDCDVQQQINLVSTVQPSSVPEGSDLSWFQSKSNDELFQAQKQDPVLKHLFSLKEKYKDEPPKWQEISHLFPSL